jgi:hypothetical protein
VTSARDIIRAALAARTVADAQHVNQLIVGAVGASFERPVGDRVNNHGLLATSGSYDFKLIENVTNMQDALLERAAAERFADLAAVPYRHPHEAAAALLTGQTEAELGRRASVMFFEADQPPRKSKRLTAVFRDEGCGIEPGYVSKSIFALGSAHKEKTFWPQGAFGLGGATTFRNADAVVLVSRRAPEMTPAEDVILVAVCLWQKSVKGKGLFYAVTADWREGRNLDAVPWSAQAAVCPEFAPGTHLALINYGSERLHAIRHSDNPNSFERVLDTRLFRPVTPVRLDNRLMKDHPRTRRGLARRFEDNPRSDRAEGSSTLPFRIGGSTYQLPVSFYFFTPPRMVSDGKADTTGQKKNFVADGHTVMFTSNGQVHHHWSPVEFRERTKLRQLSEHVLVVVETDPLPIQVRTDFFTADRSGVRASEEALRLESELAGFLDGWDELNDLNAELIREALMSGSSERPTFEISKQISRAFTARLQGFKFHGNGRNGASYEPREREPRPPRELHPDPTILKGPSTTTVLPGRSKALRFTVDARDEFFSSGRGTLTVRCSHPDVDEEDIALGPVRNGRVRIIVAMPIEAQLGEYTITAGIYGWLKASGGLGRDLEWRTTLIVVDELPEPVPPEPSGKNKDRTSEGPQVALLWRRGEQIELLPKQPGKVEQIPAKALAEANRDYRELAELGEAPVLTILLNEDYSPLKKYLQRRQAELSKIGSGHAHNRYAIDLGVALLVLHHEAEQRLKRGLSVDEELIDVARAAAAQGAISILPHFDALAKEAGIEE